MSTSSINTDVVKAYWKRKAEEKGMTVEEYKQYRTEQVISRKNEWGLKLAKVLDTNDIDAIRESALGIISAIDGLGIPRNSPPSPDDHKDIASIIINLSDSLNALNGHIEALGEKSHYNSSND